MKYLLFIVLSILSARLYAQQADHADTSSVDYSKPNQYTVGGIAISGTKYLDEDILKAIAGIHVGDKIDIPGTDISKAIQNLWKQELFQNVKVYIDSIRNDQVFLRFNLEERPRLAGFTFSGTKKGEEDDLRKKIDLNKGKVLTDNVRINTVNIIKSYYSDKGYNNATVAVVEEKDSTEANSMLYYINVDKGKRVKIDKIIINGNTAVSDGKIKGQMKKTKENPFYSIFTVSKYSPKNFEADKAKVIDYYLGKGYRDAHIISDSVYFNPDGNLNIVMNIHEGAQYYFRNITWTGNSKYTAGRLDSVLRIRKGDIYDESFLDKRLNADPNGTDVASLYQDDGYLFFSIIPVEVGIDHDSIDLEMRIYEGPQATINQVIIEGNDKTHEHVIRRAIRTIPGTKFSRADLVRSQREISTLGYFDPEKLGINPEPHPENGTVDIVYKVAEKPSDQVELQAGYGQGIGLTGTLGLKLNNFSLKQMFTKGGWSPLPSGDGQQLALSVESNGKAYTSFNVGFTEPWLGGKKPNSLTVDVYNSRYAYNYPVDNPAFEKEVTTGLSVGLGKQLSKPDDFFTLVSTVSVQEYSLHNYLAFPVIHNGNAFELSFNETFGRNSIGPDLQFPKYGSNFYISLTFTPPYSLFSNKNYDSLTAEEKYKLVEFHKWRFGAEWYNNVFSKFVLHLSAKGGFLGYYNPALGLTPFERFAVGGDPLSVSGVTYFGVDFISQRGYGVYAPSAAPASIFNKFTAELRYPISSNPNAFIYAMLFAEAGNAWYRFNQYNPFDLKRAVGAGIRVYLPIFGIVGFDYGLPFDPDPTVTDPTKAQRPQTLGQLFGRGKFSIILGFEGQ